MAEPRTLSEKIWESHVVKREPGQPDLLYVDLHLVHEVTSAQAFEGLRMAGRTVRRPCPSRRSTTTCPRRTATSRGRTRCRFSR